MSADSHPSLGADLLETVDLTLGRLHVRLPGIVISQDATTLRVDVRPAVRARTKDPVTDALEPIDLPVLRDVPVAYPRGGGMELTWPLDQGDSVWLVFCDRSMDEWRDGQGSSTQPVTPADPQRFRLSDAIAVPSAARDTEVVSTATASAVASGALVLDHDDIRLGGPSATAVALASLIEGHFDRLKLWLDTHVHLETGTTTGVPTAASPSVPSTGATTTKAV